MIVARTAAELDSALAKFPNQKVGFVPTMGALHEGHLSLIELAKKQCPITVVSIFVNPLQFAKGEDFEKYPRLVEKDIELLNQKDVTILFLPEPDVIYPNGSEITHHAGPVGEKFEGQQRPGHFDGMLTVVARLFELVQPDVAVFGEKDAQQLALVKQLAGGQKFAGKQVEIVAGPTIRSASGLALSSRNRYLSASELQVANSIPSALDAASKGTSVKEVLALAKATLHPEARLDYLELVDDTFEPVGPDFQGVCLLIIACRIGSTRLLDNRRIRIERSA